MDRQMDTEKDVPGEILRKHIGDLYDRILCPYPMACKLYSEKVLQKEMFDELQSNPNLRHQKSCIIKGIETTVSGNPQKLQVLASVLLKYTSTVPIANDILREFNQVYGSESSSNVKSEVTAAAPEESMISEPVAASQSTSGTTFGSIAIERHKVQTINVPETYSKDFGQMKKVFADLFFNVLTLMEEKQISVDLLKRYIRFYAVHLDPQLTHAVTIEDVMTIVRKECSLLNITLLEGVVENLKITEAIPLLQAYKTGTVEGCSDIALSLCFNQSLRGGEGGDTLLICDRVQFVLEWKPDEHTLQDIKSILWKAFGDMAPRVQLSLITEGSVVVTCYVPESLMDVLVIKGQENAQVLQGSGMSMLAIGHHVLFDMRSSTTSDTDNSKIMIGLLLKENAHLKAVLQSVAEERKMEELVVKETLEVKCKVPYKIKKEEEPSEEEDEYQPMETQEQQCMESAVTDERRMITDYSQVTDLQRQLLECERSKMEMTSEIESLRSYIQSIQYPSSAFQEAYSQYSIPLQQMSQPAVSGPAGYQPTPYLDTTQQYLPTPLQMTSSSTQQLIPVTQTPIDRNVSSNYWRSKGVIWGGNRVHLNSPSLEICRLVLSEIKQKNTRHLLIIYGKNGTVEELITNLDGSAVKELQISSSSFTMSTVSSSLLTNKQLELLLLNTCHLTSQDISLLCSSLHYHSTLQELHLSYTNIGDEGARQVALMLMTNTSLRRLSLWNCSITDGGVKDLSDSLKTNKTLKDLDLDVNPNITSQGAKHVSEMLSANSSIEQMRLYGTSISNDGATAICKALINNQTVKQVALPRSVESHCRQLDTYSIINSRINFLPF